MKRLSILLLGLMSLHAVATTPVSAPAPTDATALTPASAIPDPVEQRRRVFDALLKSDFAGFLLATQDESQLQEFLSQNRGAQAETEVRAKIAENAARGEVDEFDLELRRLLAPDGVNESVAVWYPLWQKQLPQTLAMVQMGLVSMATAIGANAKLSPLERSQLTELHWAINGWISRTDLADHKKFEQVVRELQALAQASGVDSMELLEFTRPQQRLDLANQALATGKRIATLYGVDVDAILRSARFEALSRDADRATVRTSLSVLGVAVSLEEDLLWRAGRWVSADDYGEMEVAKAEAEAETAADAAAANAGWPQDDVLAEPASTDEPNIGKIGGCHGPD